MGSRLEEQGNLSDHARTSAPPDEIRAPMPAEVQSCIVPLEATVGLLHTHVATLQERIEGLESATGTALAELIASAID